jgi:hypothetical protein
MAKMKERAGGEEAKFNPLVSTHPFCKRKRKKKEGITESTDEVDKRMEEIKLVFAGIFPCYVVALLFVEFMVFQGYAIYDFFCIGHSWLPIAS